MIINSSEKPFLMDVLTRVPVVLALVIAMLLTACGGGSSGSRAAPAPQTLSVSGTAVKGAIAGARVSVYALPDMNTPIYTAPDLTGADGSFRLVMPAPNHDDVLMFEVKALGDGSSTMRCDADLILCRLRQNLQASLAEILPLLKNYSMRGVHYSSSGPEASTSQTRIHPPDNAASASVKVHINAMTDMSVYQALKRAALEGNSPGRQWMSNAEGRIARLTGFEEGTKFAGIPGVDITQPDALKGASSEMIQMAMMNSAMLQQMLRTEPVASKGAEGLAAAREIVYERMTRILNDSGKDAAAAHTAMMIDVFDYARKRARQFDADHVAATMLTHLARAESGEVPDTAGPMPSPGAGLGGLSQARSFVSDLKDIQVAFFQRANDTGSTPLQEAQGIAREVISGATTEAIDSFGEAVRAISEVAAAYSSVQGVTTPQQAANGITVTVSPATETTDAQFAVAMAVRTFPASGDNTVSVMGMLEPAATGSQPGTGGQITPGVRLRLSGSVDNDHVELSVSSGIAEMITQPPVDDESADDGNQDGSNDISNLVVRLQASVEQKSSGNIFRGGIRLDRENLHADSSASQSQMSEELSLHFDGEMTYGTDSVNLSLALVWDGTGYMEPVPLGTVFETARSYRFEDEGDVLVFTGYDYSTGEPNYNVRLSLEERLGVIYLVRNITLSSSQFLPAGAAILRELPDGAKFRNVFEFFEAGELLSSLIPSHVLVEDVGIFVPDFDVDRVSPLSLAGEQWNYRLDCVGYCEGPDGFVIVGGSGFPDAPTQTIRGAYDLRVSTSVAGLGDGTGVNISLSGGQLGVTRARTTLAYGGRRIKSNTGTFDYRDLRTGLEGSTLDIRNQDGIRLNIQTHVNDDLTGRIYRDNDEFARLEKVDSNLLLIRYADGTSDFF